MPNFDAQVRVSYRDVAGLVLSCARDDVVEDPSNPGFVKEWINRAPGLPSQPAIRQPSDPPPTYLGGRFSNPKQLDKALQPALTLTGGGQKRVQFDRARSTFLSTDAIGTAFANTARPLACAYQFAKGGDASVNQTIMVAEPSKALQVWRRNAAGDAQVASPAADLTTVAGDHDDGTFLYTGVTGGTSLWEKNGAAYGAGASSGTQMPVSDQMFIGKDGANYLDGTLDALHVWACELSPATQDLIWRTLNEDGTDYSTDDRPVIGRVLWTDLTGDPLLDQYDRLRPQTGVPHRYIKVTVPSGTVPQLVQVAAAIDGIVRPDSELGGDLFTWNFSEFAGPPYIPPVLAPQDAGWSSVADFELRYEGHYTLTVTRAAGGSIILHFDVEVV